MSNHNENNDASLEFHNLELSFLDNIAILKFNRPKSLNALNNETLEELSDALEVILDNQNTQALILTGAGERAFIAGADITEFETMTDTFAGRETALAGQDVMNAISAMPMPTIAAINGFALGGGLEVALACDVRVMAKNARVGLPEVSLGIIPGFGGTQRLARLIGEGRALDLILTGRQIEAEEALMLGIVNRISDDALVEAKNVAAQMLSRGPVALGLAKEAVRRGLGVTLEQGLEIEADLFGLAVSTKDFREGVAAFLAKRKPEFKGE